MKYINFTKEELIERIEELELLSDQLLKEKEQEVTLEFAWSGNLGHWYWNIKTNNVVFNPLKVTVLGFDKEEIPEHVTYQFFTNKLHPEDYQKAMDAMLDHMHGRARVYEVEYRIQAKDGTYKWFYDRGKITQYDDDGKPLFLAGIVFDITEKKKLEEELKHKNELLAERAATDGLTNINNHRTIVEQLQSEIVEANRLRKPLSIALFDIDDFKEVNDNHGHIYGDKVLVHVAKIINENIRSTDFVGRYGGEEFMVIFPNANLSQSTNIAERIREGIEEYNFENGLKITVSGGLKQYDGESLIKFIHFADMNLYEAKENGKNQIV